MKLLMLCVLLAVFALASAQTVWQVDSGYGVNTGVADVPSQWAVLRFFPDNITIVAGDSVTWTHRSDGHTITFYNVVLSTFIDPQNLFLDPTILPMPANTGNSTANPTIVTSNSTRYSSGIMGQLNQTWTAKFPNAGTFLYFCLLHPGQVGYVVVLPAGSPAPQTQAQINTARAAAYGLLDATAASYASSIKTVPIRTKRPDGTELIEIDNGYGNREKGVSDISYY